ncbi:MAG: hypothetical protein ACYTF0_07960, partial [Planctomycetota bacterium]
TIQALRLVREARPLAAWPEAIHSLLALVIDSSDDDERDVLAQALTDLADLADIPAEEAVPSHAIHAALSTALESRAFGGGFLSGGITFCAMKPMRSIPFRVIAMLGLDDQAFPRQQRRPGFDLTMRRPRIGDRSVRTDDHHLFLETLLAARERLLLSYIGRDAQNNEALPPSVCLGSLLDTIDEGWQSADGHSASALISVVHPLHATSSRYLGDDPRLFTYRTLIASDNAAPQPRAALALPATATPAPTSIALADLIAYWSHPLKYYLQRRLNVALPTANDGAIADEDPITVDNLDRYLLKDTILARRLQQGTSGNEALATARLIQSSTLARGALGQYNLTTANAAVDRLLDGIDNINAIDSHDLDHPRLTGVVDLVRIGSLAYTMHLRPGALRAQDWLRCWITHLAGNLLQPCTGLLFGSAGTTKKEHNHWAFPALTRDQAEAELAPLLDGFVGGWDDPSPLLPATAKRFAEHCQEEGIDHEDFVAQVQRCRQGDDLDQAVTLVWRDEDPSENADFCAGLATTALMVWPPILEQRQPWEASA